jgi:hypothetical protein
MTRRAGLGLWVLTVGMLVAWIPAVGAGTIHLKYGYSVEADAWWEDGGLLYYTARGQQYAVPAGDVLRIEGDPVPPATGELPPVDLAGWGRTRWGMTEDDVKKILGDPTPIWENFGPAYSPFRKELDIAALRPLRLTALPQFSKETARLVGVVLRPNRVDHETEVALYDWMKAQYGAPGYVGQSASREAYVWRFEKTEIVLSRAKPSIVFRERARPSFPARRSTPARTAPRPPPRTP